MTILSWAALLFLASNALGAPEPRSAEFLSKTYEVDRLYKSMLGPHQLSKISLEKASPPQLLWLTGFKTDIVGADGRTPQKKEFMCHINLDIDLARHRERFGWRKVASERLFTLSQGQFGVAFPEGFGMPVMSDEPLTLFTQVLNHNFKKGKFLVRHKVTIEYVRDSDLEAPLKPLFPASAFVMALVEGKDGFFSQEKPDETTKHASCQPGQHAPGAAMGLYQDPFGRKMTGHWVVKPGPEVKHTLVTKLLNLPFDSTLHYAGAHLHPFAQSLELRDLTSGKSIFKTRATGFKRGIGLERVEDLSSASGIPLYKDHQYELVSAYDNTSAVDQDSMASVFLYILDKEFKKPSSHE